MESVIAQAGVALMQSVYVAIVLLVNYIDMPAITSFFTQVWHNASSAFMTSLNSLQP